MFRSSADGSYLFARMGSGADETTCFIDTRTGRVTFEGSGKNKESLFEKAKTEIMGGEKQ